MLMVHEVQKANIFANLQTQFLIENKNFKKSFSPINIHQVYFRILKWWSQSFLWILCLNKNLTTEAKCQRIKSFQLYPTQIVPEKCHILTLPSAKQSMRKSAWLFSFLIFFLFCFYSCLLLKLGKCLRNITQHT